MNKETRVYFTRAYGGGAKCGVTVDGKEYLIDIQYLSKYLENIIEEKGYTTGMSNKQKYPRLQFNP